jgi:hypothetical protein
MLSKHRDAWQQKHGIWFFRLCTNLFHLHFFKELSDNPITFSSYYQALMVNDYSAQEFGGLRMKLWT